MNTAKIKNQPSTLSGVIVLSALSLIPLQAHSNYTPLSASTNSHFELKDKIVFGSKSAETFSPILETTSSNTNQLLVEVFEKMYKNSSPLDADMAKVLSDNVIDLF